MTEVIAFLTSPSTGRRENPDNEQTAAPSSFNGADPEDIAIDSESFSRALTHQFEQELPQAVEPELSETGLIRNVSSPEQFPSQISVENPFETAFLLFPEEVAAAPVTPSEGDGDVLVEVDDLLAIRTEVFGNEAEAVSAVVAVKAVKAVEAAKTHPEIETIEIEAKIIEEGDELLVDDTLSAPVAITPPVPTDTQTLETKPVGIAPAALQAKTIGSPRGTDPADIPELKTAASIGEETKTEPASLDILTAQPKVQFNAPTMVTAGAATPLPVDTIIQNEQAPLPPVIGEASNARPMSEPINSLPPPVLSGQAGPNPAQQIMVAIERLQIGDRISLRLDPPDLGNVSIRLEIVEGTITAIVAAERPDTVELLARHRSELAQLLADAGFDEAETQVELQDKDIGREGKNLPGDDKDRAEERVLTLDEEREGLQNFREASRNGMTDGRLDIRV